MNYQAIRHIPMSQDAHGIDPSHIVFRLRAAKGDLQSCKLYYADRSCRQTPVVFSYIDMDIEAQDEWFDYFQVILESPYKRICYYFELDDGKEVKLYYGDFFEDHRVNDRSEYFQLPYNHPSDIVDPPSWVRDAVVYNIFPDSFATSRKYISDRPTECKWENTICHGKRGGTIKGILDNIDYISKLGFNCIYLNPIFVAGEYHKYDLIDYYHIDPCFGTNDDFRELVGACHCKGIHVIIDGVFNHFGWHFPAFEDVVKNGKDSAYKDWFYHLEFPVAPPDNPDDYPSYECFGYERMMPKTNTADPEVIKYFCNIGRYWVREFGIDGWRLDVASEINDEFWRSFRKAVKEENPECVLIGEVWETAQHWLYGDMFDSTMNYDFRKHCRRFFAEQSIDAAQFDSRVTNMRMRYKLPVVYSQLNLLDSHDVSRFFSMCGKDENRMKLAVLFQMTFIGSPSVFYGDEKGMYGIIEDEYRHKMTWTDEPSTLEDFYRHAITLRNTYQALRTGDYKTICTVGGLYGFSRSGNCICISVFLNNQEVYAELEGILPEGTILWEKGWDGKRLEPMGFLITEKKQRERTVYHENDNQ